VLRRLGCTAVEGLRRRLLRYCHQAAEGVREREALPRQPEQHRAQGTPGIRDRLRQAAGEDPVELQLGPLGAVEDPGYPWAAGRRSTHAQALIGRHLSAADPACAARGVVLDVALLADRALLFFEQAPFAFDARAPSGSFRVPSSRTEPALDPVDDSHLSSVAGPLARY